MLLNKFLNPQYLFHPLQKKLLINTIHQLLVLHPAISIKNIITIIGKGTIQHNANMTTKNSKCPRTLPLYLVDFLVIALGQF